MGKYSIEWIYSTCMEGKHPLLLEMMPPLLVDGKEYEEVVLQNLVLSKQEEKQIIDNIAKKHNTNTGIIVGEAVLPYDRPGQTHGVTINIEHITNISYNH